jgi:hypothetical protein
VAREGVDYLIVVDGVSRASGSFTLTWGRPTRSAAPCVVPDVRGLALGQATRLLEQADCVLGRVVFVESGIVPRGRVVSQYPNPGRRVRVLTPVGVEVSRGPGAGG